MSLEDIGIEAFRFAEGMVMGFLRETYPNLDLRRGTALRELLVRPLAASHAHEAGNLERVLRSTSFADVLEDGGDLDDTNAILAKFRTRLRDSRKTIVRAIMSVSQVRNVFISAGTVFTGSSGNYKLLSTLSYEVDSEVDFFTGPGPGGLYRSVGFLLEAESETPVTDVQGEAIVPPPGVVIPGLVEVTVVGVVDPGRPAEDPSEALSRIPTTLAARGLSSKLAIKAALQGPDSPFAEVVRSVAVAGYGDDVATRSRRSPFGTPNGAIDVFVRTFDVPARSIYLLDAVREGDNSIIPIPPETAAGFYYVSAVRDADNNMTGSYPFDVEYGFEPSRHAGREPEDFIRSIYQRGSLIVHIPEGLHQPQFSVEVVHAVDLAALQEYLDDGARSGFDSDILVRMPAAMEVTVNIDSAGYEDPDAVRVAVSRYVNGLRPGAVLNFSGVSSVCNALDVEITPLRGLPSITARVQGVDGNWYHFSGDVLDVRSICDSRAGIHPASTVFSLHTSDVKLHVRGHKLQ